MGVPVLWECNNWYWRKERYKVQWVTENGVGSALRSLREGINEAAARLCDATERAGFVARVKAVLGEKETA